MSDRQDTSSPRDPSKDSRAKDEKHGRDDEMEICERKIDLTFEADGKRLLSISALDEEGTELEVTVMVKDRHGFACCYNAESGLWYKCKF